MTVLVIPKDTSEAERDRLIEEVFPVETYGEETEVWVFAKSDKTTWDDREDPLGDIPYEPRDMVSPMFTADDGIELLRTMTEWYNNNWEAVKGSHLWAHLGRGWMDFGQTGIVEKMRKGTI